MRKVIQAGKSGFFAGLSLLVAARIASACRADEKGSGASGTALSALSTLNRVVLAVVLSVGMIPAIGGFQAEADEPASADGMRGTARDALMIPSYSDARVGDGPSDLPRRYTIRFEPNGADGEMEDVQVVIAEGELAPLALPACGFEFEGHDFAGWSVQADGEQELDLTGSEEVVDLCFDDRRTSPGEVIRRNLRDYASDGVITLHAMWKELQDGRAVDELSSAPSANIEAEVEVYGDEGQARSFHEPDANAVPIEDAADASKAPSNPAFDSAPSPAPNLDPDSDDVVLGSGVDAYVYCLFVGFSDAPRIRSGDVVLGAYGNAFLLGFSSSDERSSAKRAYGKCARFAVEDGEFLAAANASADEVLDADARHDSATVAGCTPLDSLLEERPPRISGNGLLVGLVDTGVPAGEGVLYRTSVIGAEPDDDNGHGTDMLATIARENPDAEIVSVKALDSEGKGTVTSVYAGITRAVELGATVINLSFSARAAQGCPAIEAAIDDAVGHGCVVVAAAGNDGANAAGYCPANVPSALTVGALGDDGRALPSSNWGDAVDIWVPSPSTSFAAASVSGQLSKAPDKARPDAVYDTVEHAVAEPEGSDGSCSVPIGDAKEAVQDVVFGASAHATVTVTAVQVDNDNKNSTNRSATTGTSEKSISVSKTNNKQHFKSASAAIASNSPGGGVSASLSGGTGHWKTTYKMSLSGNMKSAYSVIYCVHGLQKTAGSGGKVTDGAAATHEGAAIDGIRFGLNAKSYTHSVQARYQTADGGWSGYSQVLSGSYAYQSQFPGWSRAADATYKAASVGGYTAGYAAKTSYVDVYRQSYTASFNGNGGADGTSISKLTGAALGTLPSSSRLGYTFAGWWTAASGGSQISTSTAMPAGNVTYYAHWTLNSHRQTVNVRYQNADGGYGAYAAVIDENRSYGSTVSWSRAQDATYQAASLSYTVPDSAQTKFVDVNRRSYTATFNGNGGLGTTVTKRVGEALGTLPSSSRTDYLFKGWWTSASGGSAISAATVMPAGGATYYAHWDTYDHHIAFSANGGEGTMADAVVWHGSDLILPESSFTRAGYAFAGWNTQANGAGAGYQAGSTFKPDSGMTLYAQWRPVQLEFSVPSAQSMSLVMDSKGTLEKANDVAVRFANNGSVGIRVAGCEVHSAEGLSVASAPERLGEFDATMVSDSGEEYCLSDYANSYRAFEQPESWMIPVKGHKDLMGIHGIAAGMEFGSPSLRVARIDWRIAPVIACVTYDSNGGTGSMPSQHVNDGISFSAPVCLFEKGGMRFAGWAENREGGAVYTAGEPVSFSGDVTLYAQWEPS